MTSSTIASSSSSSPRRIILKEVVPSSRSFLLVTSVVDIVVVEILSLFLPSLMFFVWYLDVFLTGSPPRLIARIVLAKRLWSFWFIRNGVVTQDSMISTIIIAIVYLMILGRGLPEACGNPPDENWSVCGSIVYCRLASPFRTVLYIIIQPVGIEILLVIHGDDLSASQKYMVLSAKLSLVFIFATIQHGILHNCNRNVQFYWGTKEGGINQQFIVLNWICNLETQRKLN